MASSGKKKTTMAKLQRESRQRERRQDKLARKEARKLGLPDPRGELLNPDGELDNGLDPAGSSPVQADGEALELVEEERFDVARSA
jgi:hypothetical protein